MRLKRRFTVQVIFLAEESGTDIEMPEECAKKIASGCVEEQRKTYDQYILGLLADYDAKNNPKPETGEVEEKGILWKTFWKIKYYNILNFNKSTFFKMLLFF